MLKSKFAKDWQQWSETAGGVVLHTVMGRIQFLQLNINKTVSIPVFCSAKNKSANTVYIQQEITTNKNIQHEDARHLGLHFLMYYVNSISFI